MAIEKVINITVKETGVSDINKKVASLDVSLDKGAKSGDKLNKSLDQTKGRGNVFSGATAGLDKMSPALGGAISGMKGILVQMWAILANPLGAFLAAIVLSLTALYKAFTSTNEGADKMDQIMAGLSATVDVVRDRILKVGGAIVKFFSGDFKGAIADGKAAVSGFGDEVASEFKKAADATKFLQEVADAVRDLGVSRAKLNRDLARSKEIITDETASYKDKKKAIDEVRVAEEKQTNLELENARKKLKSIQDLNALSDTSDENLQAEADAKSALYALEEKSASDRRAIRKTEARAQNEEAQRLKAISDAKKAQIKEDADARKIIDDADKAEKKRKYDLDQEWLKKQNDAELASLDVIDAVKKSNADKLLTEQELALENERIAYETKYNNAVKFGQDTEDLEIQHLNNLNDINLKAQAKQYADEEKVKDDKIKLEQSVSNAKLDIAGNTMKLIEEIAGKGSKVGKALAIAQATINGIQGVQNAFTTASASPITTLFPAYPFIQAGLAGAFSLLQIKKIASTDPSGKSGGGGGGSGGGGSAPAAPSFNLVAGTGSNQIAEGLAGQRQPLQAYVVSGAVTNAQQMQRNIVEDASL